MGVKTTQPKQRSMRLGSRLLFGQRQDLWKKAGILLSFQSLSAAAMSTAKPATAALVFLHGLGDTPAGWSSLEDQLPQVRPELANVRYEFPAAPTIPITINGGATMPGWFDLYDWPIAVGSKDDKLGLMEGVKKIGSIIDTLRADGVERVVVGGFSQGGAVALLSAYHPAGSSVNGCVALSGWLTLKDELESNADRPPLFWGHGSYDDKVLFEQQAYGIESLDGAGVSSIEADQYPIGHSSDPKEIRAMADFLVKVLFPDECTASTSTK